MSIAFLYKFVLYAFIFFIFIAISFTNEEFERKHGAFVINRSLFFKRKMKIDGIISLCIYAFLISITWALGYHLSVGLFVHMFIYVFFCSTFLHLLFFIEYVQIKKKGVLYVLFELALFALVIYTTVVCGNLVVKLALNPGMPTLPILIFLALGILLAVADAKLYYKKDYSFLSTKGAF